MIIKDRMTGFLSVKQTKNQTVAEAIKYTHEFIYTYGLPHKVRTDGGPAFRMAFTDWLRGHSIEHVKSSAYNPQSNGLAERGVRSIKDVLKKRPGTSRQQLKEIVFNINEHIQPNCGSASQRFLKRSPRSCLPNSIEREIDHRILVQNRHRKQE